MFRRHPPAPPSGAKLVKADGSVVPLELVYEGKKRGTYRWEAVMQALWEPGDHFEIDALPARTQVGLRFEIVMPTED